MQRLAIVIICRLSSSVVVCLSVTRVYCDKTAKVRIVQFHKNVARCLIFLPAKVDDKIRRGLFDSGAKSRVGWFSTSRRYISETVRDRA